MENDVDTIPHTRVNSDSNLIKSNKIKEKINSRNFKQKMNCFLLILFLILIIIIIIFYVFFFQKEKSSKI